MNPAVRTEGHRLYSRNLSTCSSTKPTSAPPKALHSCVRLANAETFDHAKLANTDCLVLCVKNMKFLVASTSTAELFRCRTEGKDSSAQEEGGNNTGLGSARESASASGDAGPRVEATLKDRVPHERELCTLRSYPGRNR